MKKKKGYFAEHFLSMQIFLELQRLVYDFLDFLESSIFIYFKHIALFDEVDQELRHEKKNSNIFLDTIQIAFSQKRLSLKKSFKSFITGNDPCALKKQRNLKIKSTDCTMTAWLGIWEVMHPLDFFLVIWNYVIWLKFT